MNELSEKIRLWQAQPSASDTVMDGATRTLLESARIVTLPAGTTVFRPSDRCENYLLVGDGRVRVSLITASGHELLLYRVEPGQACILTTTCLMSATAYPAAGVTETEVSALLIGKDAFDLALAASAVFRRSVFRQLSHRFADILGRIEAVKYADLDSRLVNELFRRAGDDTVVHATHQALATDIGSSREVVSRHLKIWERDGLVRLGRGRIELLDRPALRSLADMDA